MNSNLIIYGREGCGKTTAAYRMLQIDRTKFNERYCPETKESARYYKWRRYFEYTVENSDHDKQAIGYLYTHYGLLYQQQQQQITIVLRRAHLLSLSIQLELRKYMESPFVRYILLCTSYLPIIDPIQSRCMVRYVPPPTFEQQLRYLLAASTPPPEAVLLKIIKKSGGSYHKLRGYLDYYELFQEVVEVDEEYVACLRELVAMLGEELKEAAVEKVRATLNKALFVNYDGRNLFLDLWRYASSKLSLRHSLEEYLEISRLEMEYNQGKKRLIHLDYLFWGVLWKKVSGRACPGSSDNESAPGPC